MRRVQSGTRRLGARELMEVNVYFHNGLNEVMPKWKFIEALQRCKSSIKTYRYL